MIEEITWHPQNLITNHSVKPHKGVLDSDGESMTYMQYTCDIRGRENLSNGETMSGNSIEMEGAR